ncbi:MAG TPA: mechanosensitive ion channel domain-containing protein [Puia sp.]|jgi:small-conductance mechanosensitive channel|nr:mechanosensitive ion channel domain-containing protein [Puia sp.]
MRIACTLTIALFLLAGTAANGQGHHAKKEEHKSHIEYSLDTVMQKIDDLYETLNNINIFQQKHFDTANIRHQLSGINTTLDRIRDNLVSNAVTEYKRVLLDEYVLKDIRNQLQLWRNELFQYNNNLVKMNAEIAAFTKDSVLQQLITDSIYREMYLDELAQLRQKWRAARKNTDTSLVRVNALQSAISKPWFATLDLIAQVTIIKGQIAGVLFKKEYPYIWEGDIASGDQFSNLTARSFRSESGLADYFWTRNWGYYLYALVIGLLFFYWVWNNFRRVRTEEKGPEALQELHLYYLRPLPVLSALVIILTILPFFNFNAPTSFTQLGQLVLVIVVSILFWLQWPRRLFRYWIYIVVFYILFVGTGAALVPKLGARIWLLALSVGSIFLVRNSLRQIRGMFPYPRVMRIAWWIFLLLDMLSVLSNILGRLSLSKIFVTTAIFSLVQIILLSVFVDCIVEALRLQTVESRLRQQKEQARATNQAALFGKMETSVYRLLALIAFLTWAMAFTINLNIYDPAYALAVRIWDHTVKLGSVSFRVGNVLLFIFVLYVSNQLQKYIGFLYGTSDGGQAQPGHKGSRLVMFRLILIIAGFMLAIVASGLPIDRITIVLGALGVGIGLGLQNIVNNLVSGIILIFERPFQIGDYIELNGKKGVVRDIGIRSSKMMTENGTEIIMPNGDLLSGEVINWTIRNNQIRIEIPMTVEGGHPFEEISGIITEALKEHSDLSKDDQPRVLLNSANEKATSFTVLLYVGNIGQIQTIKSEIIRLLIGKLAEHQIKTV